MFYMNESLESATNRYLADQEAKEAKLPKCDICGEPIYGVWTECEQWKKFCPDCTEEWIKDRTHEAEYEE